MWPWIQPDIERGEDGAEDRTHSQLQLQQDIDFTDVTLLYADGWTSSQVGVKHRAMESLT